MTTQAKCFLGFSGKEAFILLVSLVAYLALLFFHKNFEFIGLMHDDGIYLLGAKALASGLGFTMPNFPEHPPIIKYPPLYSLLLSFFWLLNPHFPDNVNLLKIVPVAFAVGGMYLTYRLFINHFSANRLIPILMTLAVATNLFTIISFTRFMSESLFLFLSLATLFAAMKVGEQIESGSLSLRKLAPLVVLSVLTFYARSFGLVIVMVVAFWLGVSKSWKVARHYFLASFSLCLPWIVWVAYQQDNNPFLKSYVYDYFIIYNYMFSYSEEMKMRWMTTENPWSNIIVKNMISLYTEFGRLFLLKLGDAPIIGKLFGGWVTLSILGLTAASIYQKKKDLLLWYLLAYLSVCLVWPDSDQANRFLIVVFPVLAYVIASFLNTVIGQKLATKVIAVLFSGLILVNIFYYANYLSEAPEFTKRYESQLQEFHQVLAALNQYTTEQDVILNSRYSFYPLYIDRQVKFFNVLPTGATDALSDEQVEAQLFLSRIMLIKHTKATFLLEDMEFYKDLVYTQVIQVKKEFALKNNSVILYKLLDSEPK